MAATHRVAGLGLRSWGRPGRGPCVVALHGLTSTGDVWADLAARVRAVVPGACVLAPDLPGRGGSVAVPAPPGLDGLADRVVAAVRERATEPVVVVGHSMGAFLAPLVAARLGPRLAGVVLLDGGCAPQPSPVLHPLVVRAVSTLQGRRLARAWEDVDAFVQAVEGRAVAHRPDLLPAVRTWSAAALTGPPGALRVALDRRRLADDAVDTLCGPTRLPVIAGTGVPVRLLAATRGADDRRAPFLSDAALATAKAQLPRLHVERVDANHVTILLDPAPAAAVHGVLAAA